MSAEPSTTDLPTGPADDIAAPAPEVGDKRKAEEEDVAAKK